MTHVDNETLFAKTLMRTARHSIVYAVVFTTVVVVCGLVCACFNCLIPGLLVVACMGVLRFCEFDIRAGQYEVLYDLALCVEQFRDEEARTEGSVPLSVIDALLTRKYK